ncbi:hypothetical protein TB2_033868 [Malus domestica]
MYVCFVYEHEFGLVWFRVLAFESKAEPDLSVTVNGLRMPNTFVIGLPPWTNYTVMKRAFDEGWGAAIAKTHSRNYRGNTSNLSQILIAFKVSALNYHNFRMLLTSL